MSVLLDLIKADEQELFEAEVFGRTTGIVCDEDGSHTYVFPLSSEEEIALFKKAFEAGGKWLEFLEKYADTYPLTNECMMELVANYQNPQAYELLKKSLQNYGYNEQVGLKICEIISGKDFDDAEFIDLFCTSGRVCYPDVAQKLDFIDKKYSKLYISSTGEYMGWNAKKRKTES